MSEAVDLRFSCGEAGCTVCDGSVARLEPRVCPFCSSDLLYPRADGGKECGHCDARFEAGVPGCPLDPRGQHDETWMNDGACACGADGSSGAGVWEAGV